MRGLDSVVRPFRIVEMDANTLFGQALGFGAQWNVVKSEMDMPQRQLRLELDFPACTIALPMEVAAI